MARLSSGFGVGLSGRLHCVVDLNSGAIAQLEYSGAHDLLARIDAGNHPDLIAA